MSDKQVNIKGNTDHSEIKSLKQSSQSVQFKNQNIQQQLLSEMDKIVNTDMPNNIHAGNCQNETLNKQNNNIGKTYGLKETYQRGDFFHYYNNDGFQFCKNHSTKEATKICLHAGCSLTREICDECEKQQPHTSHPQSVVDAKRFFVDVELGLKEFRLNSPLMNASEMLEQGSMNNMLVEKSPQLVKILALIDQTENAKRVPMKKYELERYIRDVMGIFSLDKFGKLESHNHFQLSDKDVEKGEINSVLLMLRDLENVVRFLHDDFAKALRFGDYGYYAGNSPQGNQYSLYQNQPGNFYNHSISSNQNGIEGGTNKSQNDQTFYKSNNNYIISNQNNSFNHHDSSVYSKNQNHPQENIQGFSKSQGEKQFHPTSYNNDMDIEIINSFHQKNKLLSQSNNAQGNNLNVTNQIIQNDVLKDPAFLKRPRGRPKGSKCKRKNKYKGKYTDDEKLQILNEVGKSKSVQVIAEKYWARQLNYELDPQAVSSRRPYRTFSRDQKNAIIQEAIKKRDIVLVAQECDVNAQVLKRWILKGSQDLLQTQEMRQMMNAVPNSIGDEDDNSQSQDDSDIDSDDEDEYDDDDDDNRDQMNDDELFEQNNQDNKQQNNSKSNKYQQQKFGQKIKNGGGSNNNKFEMVLQEQTSSNEILVKNEETNNEDSNLQLEEREKESRKRKQYQGEKVDENDVDDSNNEDEDGYSSSENAPSKKIKHNSDKQLTNSENENPNKISTKTSTDNKYKSKTIDSNITDILNLDLLKKIDLKNLDLSANTQSQSEELNIMQKKLQEELMKMKQQQQEKITKKQNGESKKFNIVNPKTQQQ